MWEEIIKQEFSFIKTCKVINDGQAFTFAEYELISPKPFSMVNFVIGTGIGGGIIIDKHLWKGNTGTSGALGHIKIAMDSEVVCSCRKHGCIESFASARAIETLWNKNGRDDSFSSIVELAHNGNTEAIDAIKVAGKALGLAIANVISIMEPEVIVLGGGVVSAFENSESNIYYDEAIQSAKENVFLRVGNATRFIKSVSPLNGGIIGAAMSTIDWR